MLEHEDEIARLRLAGYELIAAIERQLAMHGKGLQPSDRVKDAIASFRRQPSVVRTHVGQNGIHSGDSETCTICHQRRADQ